MAKANPNKPSSEASPSLLGAEVAPLLQPSPLQAAAAGLRETLDRQEEQVAQAEQAAVPAISRETQPVMPRQGDPGRPFCGKHQCLMKATGSRQNVTHYACPVPHCDGKEKRVRQTAPVPREPTPCPQLTCREPQQFLQIDESKSTLANAHMQCPKCKFAVKAPRGQYAAFIQEHHRRSQLQRDDLGD